LPRFSNSANILARWTNKLGQIDNPWLPTAVSEKGDNGDSFFQAAHRSDFKKARAVLLAKSVFTLDVRFPS
jgi:hypothetical protein